VKGLMSRHLAKENTELLFCNFEDRYFYFMLY
jgi:hypothetical protein